jgi:hypothetical protein
MHVTVVDMIELRPSCERCDVDLPVDSPDARICTFECTFCASCAEAMGGACPNCTGNLVARPIRPAFLLATSPPSTVRVFNPELGERTSLAYG